MENVAHSTYEVQQKQNAYTDKRTHAGRYFCEETSTEMPDQGIHSAHKSNTTEQGAPQNL